MHNSICNQFDVVRIGHANWNQSVCSLMQTIKGGDMSCVHSTLTNTYTNFILYWAHPLHEQT